MTTHNTSNGIAIAMKTLEQFQRRHVLVAMIAPYKKGKVLPQERIINTYIVSIGIITF